MAVVEKYQKRLDRIRYLNLNGVLNTVQKYVVDSCTIEESWPYIEDPLAFSLSFYQRINPVWCDYLTEFSKTPNFRYIEGLQREECGCFLETDKTPYRMLVSKNHTIEDIFILVHEFGHMIADRYQLYSEKLTQEVFPLLMEFVLMATYKDRYPVFETYFTCRLNDINYDHANYIIEEINFIHTYQSKRDLSTSDIQKIETFLDRPPLDILFSYIVAEYYLEDYQKLEKRKELYKR